MKTEPRVEKAEVEQLVNEAATVPTIQRMTKPVGVTLEEFLGLFEPEVHDVLRGQLKKPNARGLVCFENLQTDSSQFGHRTAVAYGPGMTYDTLITLLVGRLGDVPSRFQYPVKYYIKPAAPLK
jgi:hypothetical protein